MKKVLKYLTPFVLALLTACSVSEPGETPDAKPVLKTVQISVSELQLAPGGEARLPFSVQDPSYSFNYSCNSPDGQVAITLTSGSSPEAFRLKEVVSGGVQGNYEAIIEDTSLGEPYDLYAVLVIKTGGSSFVQSDRIRISSAKDPTLGIRTGLPVVYIDTAGGADITSKDSYLTATVGIKGFGGYPDFAPASARVKGRGNTTWTWPKKPYLIAFDSRQSVLGLPKHKRWILLANFMDRTLMRNLVSMKVSSMMTNLAWTPHCVPVEVVLNGKHKGSYLLIEQVRVDKNRVNISETGGYLFELDFHYDNPVQWKDHNIPFSVQYPDDDDITAEQKTYAKNYIAEVSNTIYGADFKDPQNGYAKYLDVDSYIDYWIVYEVMTNHELGNPGSVYFHKDVNGKLTAGPCWDFDWGVLSFNTSPQAQTGLVNGHAIWYDRLFQDPDFKAKVKARFLELKPQLQTIPDYMEECRALLSESAKLNFAMWNPADDKSQNGGNIINGDENLTFDAAIDRLKKNFNTHLAVIESKL